ncbi:sensor histidine kinase [Hippea jasoniae]|uniref:sensor histidine kinase n=1 Tax=Hippea jasoniae TaxID=944479 RepID=UPI000550AA87|nr:ATP-binding protein [Hippea jasoniae]
MSDDKLKNLQVMFEAVLDTSKKLENSYNELKRKFELLEGKLESNRRYLENILKSIDTGVASIDLDGRIVTFNRKAEEVFGVDESSVKGRHFGEVFAIKSLLELNGCGIAEFFKDNKRVEIETNSSKKILSVSANCVEEEDGKISGAVIVFSDITQVEKLKEENYKKEKLAIIGQMAASIAHDIKNPLASIELLVPLLDDGTKKEIVDNIMMSIKRINNIVNNTLLFTKTVNYSPEQIDSISLAHELEFEIYASIKNADVKFNKEVENFTFVSDKNLLKSALVNILSNATDAAKTTVELKVYKKGDRVVFEIIDDGEGIEDISMIFEPFYTSKKNGTGLGLAIVRQAVEILNGDIEISTSKRGTSFKVLL